MAYFTRETLRFLTELEKHNERDWFERNKARYVEHVKEPAERFTADTAAALGMDGKLMRIYRDIRFSKDKSPYKTNVGASFHPRGRARGGPLVGGIYVHVAPRSSFVASGAWHPEPAVLARVRDAIVADPAGWKKARKIGLDEDEEALKKAPKGFDPAHPFIEDIRHKNFTASVELTDAQATAPDLPRRVAAAAKDLAPLNDFLAKALQ